MAKMMQNVHAFRAARRALDAAARKSSFAKVNETGHPGFEERAAHRCSGQEWARRWTR